MDFVPISLLLMLLICIRSEMRRSVKPIKVKKYLQLIFGHSELVPTSVYLPTTRNAMYFMDVMFQQVDEDILEFVNLRFYTKSMFLHSRRQRLI